MARIVKEFDPVKKLPFWYLEFDGDRYGPFTTREDADEYQDKEFGPDDRDDEMLVGAVSQDRG